MSIASSIGGLSTAPTSSRPTGFNSLSSEDFIKIMVTELTRQDPLSPTDSKAILEQISSIRSIESNATLKTSIEAMVRQTEFSSAGALLGKKVQALTDLGTETTGVVTGVSNTREGARVALSTGFGAFVRNVLQVSENTPAAPGARPAPAAQPASNPQPAPEPPAGPPA